LQALRAYAVNAAALNSEVKIRIVPLILTDRQTNENAKRGECQYMSNSSDSLLQIVTYVSVFSAFVNAGATIVLAWVTWLRDEYTKTLANITKRQERIKDLRTVLEAAETIQQIAPQFFVERLGESNHTLSVPQKDVRAIQTLALYKRYLAEWDPDCHRYLDPLCDMADALAKEQFAVRFNDEETARNIKLLQERLQWFVDGARAEIGKGLASDTQGTRNNGRRREKYDDEFLKPLPVFC